MTRSATIPMARKRRILAVLCFLLGVLPPVSLHALPQSARTGTDDGTGAGELWMIVAQTRDDAEELRREALAGSGLGTLGGVSLGQVPRGDLRREFQEALAGLGPGELSQVFPLDGSFVFLRWGRRPSVAEDGSAVDVVLRGDSEAAATERSRVRQAMNRGVEHLAAVDYGTAYQYLLSDVAARRYDLSALAEEYLKYEEMEDVTPHPDYAVYHRISQRDATITESEIAAIALDMDRMTAAALYCDRIALAPGFADAVEASLAAGGYPTSHVLLAMIMMKDNGCESPLGPELEEKAAEATLGLIDDDHGRITDIEIEAAAFLAVWGRRDLVSWSFIEGVLDAQTSDGGWKIDPRDSVSNWHPTGLAVILFGEMLREGEEVGPWVIQSPRQ